MIVSSATAQRLARAELARLVPTHARTTVSSATVTNPAGRQATGVRTPNPLVKKKIVMKKAMFAPIKRTSMMGLSVTVNQYCK